jgi:hypothetical protein
MSAIASGAVLALAAACAAAPAPAPPQPAGTPAPVPREEAKPSITSGRDVIAAMHDRWSGKWYRSLVAKQTTTTAIPGREITQQAMEYVSLPGRRRIDYLPVTSGRGVVYEGGRVHAFVNRRKQTTAPGVQLLELLLEDVYAQPAAATQRTLDSAGVKLDVMRRARWQGKNVFIVGAAEGDTTSSQFWVDPDRLVLVRFIERQARRAGAPPVVIDSRVTAWHDADGVPVPSEMSTRRGTRVSRGTLTQIRTNVELSPAVFDPTQYAKAPLPK